MRIRNARRSCRACAAQARTRSPRLVGPCAGTVPQHGRSRLAGEPRASAMAVILHRVGRYDVLREIGRGGMATVYLARQRDLDRHVALKELAVDRASDASFADRFLLESRMTGKLAHP